MQKTLTFLVAFFAVLLLREKQNRPFVSLTFFCITLYLENENKTSREMFSYQFVAHMPKTRQI